MTEALLEHKSGELELLEFRVGGNSYGIDVARVRELLQYRPVQNIPHAQVHVEGVISPRDELLTVIDLASYLQHSPSERQEQDIFVIAEIRGASIAFHVHQVVGMHRMTWNELEKPDAAVFGGEEALVIGVAKMGGTLVSVLDFEKIMEEINPYAC